MVYDNGNDYKQINFRNGKNYPELPISQYVEADLNKKSYSGPKTTAGWKDGYPIKVQNPRKSVMYYEFSKGALSFCASTN